MQSGLLFAAGVLIIGTGSPGFTGVAHAAGGGLPAPVVYTGCCDASAAEALDGDRFAVGNDEDNILRVYHRGRPGAPVAALDVSGFLGVDPDSPEADIEGAARIGGTIYWITSHGRNKNAKERTSRQRLFATEVKVTSGGIELAPAGKPYANLLGDLLNEPRLRGFNLAAASVLEPTAPGALNIEGLSATPEGHLLIGFRNPIPRGMALIVPLLNPAGLIGGDRARFGDPILLDLGGLGIRSITRAGGRYLVVAGPHDGGRSRLYEWDGGLAIPRMMPEFDLRGINPEAVLVYPGAAEGEFQILSDDGTLKIDGRDCKLLEEASGRQFRSFHVRRD